MCKKENFIDYEGKRVNDFERLAVKLMITETFLETSLWHGMAGINPAPTEY